MIYILFRNGVEFLIFSGHHSVARIFILEKKWGGKKKSIIIDMVIFSAR